MVMFYKTQIINKVIFESKHTKKKNNNLNTYKHRKSIKMLFKQIYTVIS